LTGSHLRAVTDAADDDNNSDDNNDNGNDTDNARSHSTITRVI